MQQDPEIPQGRRPKNAAEAEFFDLASQDGWLLTKRGWPDFFLKRENQVCAVEVKPASSRGFKREQARVAAALIAAGIPYFIWSPDAGLTRLQWGVGGLQFFAVGSIAEGLDVCEGESEGKHELHAVPIADAEPTEPVRPTTPLPSSSETAQAIDRVWACYADVMKPRRLTAGDDDRLIIRNALREASAEELEICVRTCEASDYHMKRGQHTNRKGGKYNTLGKIMKPRPRLGETQRSRIDWWLDRDESSGVAGFPSADTAIVGQRQVEVQRGHQSGDPEMVRKADDAEAWLTKHGIETVRDARGYPSFRRMGTGDSE